MQPKRDIYSPPRVTPRIRALQGRLMDSLPGAFECLSPAQKEAIVSLHKGGHALRKADRRAGKPFETRALKHSRSHDEILESETDDSGIRGGFEDDSDPDGRRFILEGKGRPDIPNGVGNVSRMLLKHRAATETLDVRFVRGEKNPRSRITPELFSGDAKRDRSDSEEGDSGVISKDERSFDSGLELQVRKDGKDRSLDRLLARRSNHDRETRHRTPEPLKSNLKAGLAVRPTTSLDYRTQMNRYAHNWNNLLASSASSRQRVTAFKEDSPGHARSEQSASKEATLQRPSSPRPPATQQKDSRFAPSVGNQRRPWESRYHRSRSLDRKFLVDSSDDDDDTDACEERRRQARVRRYGKNHVEWDTPSRPFKEGSWEASQDVPRRSQSSWDLSDSDGPGFRSRSALRSRWKSEENNALLQDSKGSFARREWRRRSCDGDLDAPKDRSYRWGGGPTSMGYLQPEGPESLAFSGPTSLGVDLMDRRRWYRRTCDPPSPRGRWVDRFSSPAFRREPSQPQEKRSRPRAYGEDRRGARPPEPQQHPRKPPQKRCRTPVFFRGKLRFLKSIFHF